MSAAEFDPATAEVCNEHFAAWWRYWGELLRCQDPIPGGAGETVIWGFENASDGSNAERATARIPDEGACYGYLGAGRAIVGWQMPGEEEHELRTFTVSGGQWFVTPGGCSLHLNPESRLVVTQRSGFRALPAMGGPLEERGRLKYIDLCSDTLLCGPPVQGDPCLNHLHFPPGIDQTEHFHPSNRSGLVAYGRGTCVTPYGESELVPGLLFHIPHHGRHKFRTLRGEHMGVVAYHPDSDWGPEHEEHPMINRTWVGDVEAGHKVDNSSGVHQEAETVPGFAETVGV